MAASNKRILTSADYSAIARMVAKEVPKAIRKEFGDIGLPVETTEQQIAAQELFAFLRRMQKGTHAAEGVVGKSILNLILKGIGALILLGAGVFVSRAWPWH